ncbi:TauD/TfdA family dioxygenase [Dactylosporangium sp. NPDC051484]|uniref:TauD/TfdA family dioxygenase n=1 Tax=Dactylosporangium sp. NPDC051484 TaxID=3154942 RepID=UPI00344E264C
MSLAIVNAGQRPILRLVDEDAPVVMLEEEIGPDRAWRGTTVTAADWTVPVDHDALREITRLVQNLRAAPLPLLLRRPEHFDLPHCRELMRRVRRTLTDGIGLVVVDRMPLHEMSREEATTVYWTLGQFLGQPVATKWDGTMLYDVKDTGKRFGHGVRGSATNVELTFHTDNAFGATLPDFVGLLCLQQSQSGGTSRFCSLYTVHNELLRRAPELLRRLYQPAYYDRQAEHAPDAPQVLRAPMFSYAGGKLAARLVPGLVRRGYALMGEEPDAPLVDALECLESVLADESLRVEFKIEPGQLQYLNNLECGHYRSAFVDAEEPERKRHLIRVWYRDHGGPTYDGYPSPS